MHAHAAHLITAQQVNVQLAWRRNTAKEIVFGGQFENVSWMAERSIAIAAGGVIEHNHQPNGSAIAVMNVDRAQDVVVRN
jgi:hypothetical protein